MGRQRLAAPAPRKWPDPRCGRAFVIAWPASRAGEALEALARHSGHNPKIGEIPSLPPHVIEGGPKLLGEWIEGAALHFGLEVEPAEIRYVQAERCIQSAPPALVWCSDVRLLALLTPDTVIAPDFSVRRVGREAIRSELCLEAEGPLTKDMDSLL